MTPPDPDDPLLRRLHELPAARLDDVTAARTLARAEAVLAAPPAARLRADRRWLLPAALVAWGTLYVWGAVGELRRLFPTVPAAVALTTRPAAAPRHLTALYALRTPSWTPQTFGSGSQSGGTHSARARGDISSSRE